MSLSMLSNSSDGVKVLFREMCLINCKGKWVGGIDEKFYKLYYDFETVSENKKCKLCFELKCIYCI